MFGRTDRKQDKEPISRVLWLSGQKEEEDFARKCEI